VVSRMLVPEDDLMAIKMNLQFISFSGTDQDVWANLKCVMASLLC